MTWQPKSLPPVSALVARFYKNTQIFRSKSSGCKVGSRTSGSPVPNWQTRSIFRC
ncbi:hypothetical protein M0657_012034 [Pyricularia oryzae]|nr:hypothetical protein M9X92_012076 [Pyricularia oryzae]KAI7908990.1 hypothetical protein M0657_012034 [Pyricularia oryzae]